MVNLPFASCMLRPDTYSASWVTWLSLMSRSPRAEPVVLELAEVGGGEADLQKAGVRGGELQVRQINVREHHSGCFAQGDARLPTCLSSDPSAST